MLLEEAVSPEVRSWCFSLPLELEGFAEAFLESMVVVAKLRRECCLKIVPGAWSKEVRRKAGCRAERPTECCGNADPNGVFGRKERIKPSGFSRPGFVRGRGRVPLRAKGGVFALTSRVGVFLDQINFDLDGRRFGVGIVGRARSERGEHELDAVFGLYRVQPCAEALGALGGNVVPSNQAKSVAYPLQDE